MPKVYSWPPVGILASKWTLREPVAVSRSLVSGARYSSSMQRPRYAVTMRVGGNSFDYTGHGYMEVLKTLLKGGANFVRIEEPVEPYRGGMSDPLGSMSGGVITWLRGGTMISWSQSDLPIAWMGPTGGNLVASVNPSTPRYIRVEGLAPGTTAVRPGQRVLVIKSNAPPVEALVTNKAVVADNGVVWIRVTDPPGTDVTHIVLRHKLSRVFAVDGPMPEVPVQVNEEPIWEWKFIEVFQDEVAEPFVEDNPW